MKVMEELRRSAVDPALSDAWSTATLNVYFGAAVQHGMLVEHDNVPDIYSYAMEAAEALNL